MDTTENEIVEPTPELDTTELVQPVIDEPVESEPTPPPVEPEKKNDTVYVVEMLSNGEASKDKGTDIAAMLMDMKPGMFHTEVHIKVSTGTRGDKMVLERVLNITQARRLFSSEDVMAVFLSNLNF